jgi:phosphoribosyl 1,2-cyclic phosphate phosphodiesterase
MRVTVLGCGTSSGVPVIGCRCAVCRSDDPRNRRRRCAVLVEQGTTTVLVDTPPELRQQCLDAGVDRLDAILYTHAHADHVNGLDDVRSFNHLMSRAIDAHGQADVLARIQERFGYAFQPPDPGRGWWRPALRPVPFEGPFRVGELDIRPIEQRHGRRPSFGFRFGPFAYSPDVDGLDDTALAELEGLEVWIVDCLRDRPHPSHAHLERTLGWIERLRPARAILTHMAHDLGYADLAARLPAGVEPAYDGMVLDIPALARTPEAGD